MKEINIKKLLISCLTAILLFANSCNEKATAMEENSDTTYLLGRYLINPAKKQVSVYEMTGGMMPNGGHWDGYRYVPDTTINYDSTTLFIVGNQIFFKEEMHFSPELDFNSLQVIHSDLDDYEYVYFFARDKNYLYKNTIGTRVDDRYIKPLCTIDLSGYETINDRIYQKGDDLYFLSMEHGLGTTQFKLVKIAGAEFDISTLKHLWIYYFYDKDGLYRLKHKWISKDEEYYTVKQLEKSNGKTITPVLDPNYFIYGDKVYSTHGNYDEALPLNPEKMKELVINDYYQVYLLADDNYVFKADRYGGYSDSGMGNSEFFSKNVNQWQVIFVNGYFVKEKNSVKADGATLYLPSAIKRFEGWRSSDNERNLVKTPDGFYAFRERFAHTLEKIGKVLIFNFDAKEYEELDASQYRYVSNGFRIYKNRVYDYDGLPIKNPIDTENLRFITHHGKRTNYLTDGKLLIYTKAGGIVTKGEGSDKIRKLHDEEIISGVDFSTLKVITKDILIDKDNIYNGGGGIGIIPIKALNLDVKIFTE